MFKYFTYALTALLISAGGTAYAADEIVFIDLDRVFEEYYKTELAKIQLEEQAAEYQVERDEKVEELKAMEDEFNQLQDEAKNRAFSSEVREEKRNEAEDKLLELKKKENEIRRFSESVKRQMEGQSARMRDRIVKDITKEVDRYALNQGYRAVVDMSGETANGLAVMLYVDPKAEITEDILTVINQGHTGE